MHELAIVSDLIDLCEENLKANGAKKIVEIHIKVGVLSGVEAHYLKECFEAFKLDTNCKDAKLIINEQKVKIKCKDCDFECELEKNEFSCLKCGSTNIKVIDGEEMYLMRLVME